MGSDHLNSPRDYIVWGCTVILGRLGQPVSFCSLNKGPSWAFIRKPCVCSPGPNPWQVLNFNHQHHTYNSICFSQIWASVPTQLQNLVNIFRRKWVTYFKFFRSQLCSSRDMRPLKSAGFPVPACNPLGNAWILSVLLKPRLSRCPQGKPANPQLTLLRSPTCFPSAILWSTMVLIGYLVFLVPD